MAMRDSITNIGSYYYAMPCAKINGIYQEYGIPPQAIRGRYPACASFLDGSNTNQYAVVHASMNGPGPENSAAVLDLCFGPSLWMALMVHAIGLEIYVCPLIGDIASSHLD